MEDKAELPAEPRLIIGLSSRGILPVPTRNGNEYGKSATIADFLTLHYPSVV
jgi:hypothetical protein